MLLAERFEFKTGFITKKDGEKAKIAYIDRFSSTSETYEYKAQLKSLFGANWDQINKRWFWYLSNDPAKNEWIIKNKIEAAIDYLVKRENVVDGEEGRDSEDVKAQVRDMIKELDNIINAPVEESPNQAMSTSEIKEKLEDYKQELVNILNGEDFKSRIEPFIKFRNAQGHKFSFGNAILIYIQDAKATLVKSPGRWKEYNRIIKPNSPSIALWTPMGGKQLSKEEKMELTNQFLKSLGKKSVAELEVGQKEELSILLKPQSSASVRFSLVPNFYDVRFTEVMHGKEDGVVKEPDEIEWHDDKTEENENSIQLFDAILKVIEGSTVQIKYEDDLGGAMGVSRGGTIAILKNAKKNVGSVDTLIHEFAHELLHQKYLAARGQEYTDFFIGKSEGRAVIEQQAELVGWIVMKSFGIDMKTSINYIGIWGIDASKATRVFDTVAKVASHIISKMQEVMKGVTEGEIKKINEITGWEVAKLCGEEAIEAYKKSASIDSGYNGKIQEATDRFYNLLNRMETIKI